MTENPKGVYKNSGFGWKRIFVTSSEETEFDSESTDETISAAKSVNSIFIDKRYLLLAIDSGIFTSKDREGNWRRFTSNGPLSQKIRRLLFKENLYAAFVISADVRKLS